MNLNQQIEQWLKARLKSFQSDSRPFITLAYAQSWDGSITTRCGETLSFSGEESLRLTHQLRSLHDGIVVGIGTVLSDDPQLTVREWSGPNPQPIVLDSQFRTPKNARIRQHPDKKCWIVTVNATADAQDDRIEILTVSGSDEDPQQVSLAAAMRLLRERGIRSLMVEGGAEVITGFLQAHLADSLVLTVAPTLVGGYKAVGDLQNDGGYERLSIDPLHYGKAGRDLVVWGDLQYGGPAP
ncbi:MAG: RibD family protein [Pseudohongiellaceae bacterium]